MNLTKLSGYNLKKKAKSKTVNSVSKGKEAEKSKSLSSNFSAYSIVGINQHVNNAGEIPPILCENNIALNRL